ncbi:allophanate hydrolase [Aureimonas pseudogalii]|uniref:Allophanate hydrolase n=1 Tax=Aureimonas pseudogalii TaxID=1744844 RepID=A0A7W6H8J2_9HYPH|nr:allophanate hydrolase [Aureimonas pseudogalii]MBB4000522.1 allophanate hydrolase [Aureimonas pseudogalii]
MTELPIVLDFARLRAAFAAGVTPVDLVTALLPRLDAADPAVFIATMPADALLAAARELTARAPEPNSLPLWGLPFAVKDNIDVAGLPTTAACPAFAYEPAEDATVVARLKAAGALVVGKTNLDQFATGLNGTRSPHGAPRCVFDADYVSGGSSSGSGVAVAAGLAAFALGTDTAGSGRVPAAFNNIVGIKPSPGRVSTSGVVPACRSIDVVTVFATSVADGLEARRVMDGFDDADAYSRAPATVALPASLRLGVPAPEEREFFGNAAYAALYEAAVARAQSLGAEIVPFDYRPFREAAALLYEGPWVAERLHAVTPFIDAHAADMDPVVRGIVEGARGMTAVDAFEGQYRLAAFRRAADAEWAKVDALILPTSPDIQTVEAMRVDPVALNARFGRFTNFANFFGCAAIAVPAGFTQGGLPFGVQLVAPQDTDEALGAFASALHAAAGTGAGLDRNLVLAPVAAMQEDRILVTVVGAHLTGMPLNGELTELGGRLVREGRTAPFYRLYALPGTVPAKPGLVRDPAFAGPGIAVEVWSLDPAGFGRFVAGIPQPLGIGKLALDDGSEVSGFVCEPSAIRGALEVTEFGGWRAYVAARTKAA